MATAQLNINRPRTTKKLEKPRPLKLNQRHTTVDERISTMEELLSLINDVAMQLSNGSFDTNLQLNILAMYNNLKLYALQLEEIYKDQLDRAFVAIRNGSQDERLHVNTRVYLLELIELRAKHWRHTDSMDAYYVQKKMSHMDNVEIIPESPVYSVQSPLMQMHSPTAQTILAPGELIKNSGKFSKPTRIPGKNYCKDEVVIRNSDSGKVMGIKGRRVHMIEELSETIISFQRVNPGAKERLVQITGTSEDKIHYAKDLIKDTIQRNASPVRLEQGIVDKGGIGDSNSSLSTSASDESNRQNQNTGSLLHSFSTNDASIGEYKHTVTVGNYSLKITGSNLDLVRMAKLVLDEYFSGEFESANSGVEFFNIEEEQPVVPAKSTSQIQSSSTQTTSFDGNDSTESDETYKPVQNSDTNNESVSDMKGLSYEFLLQCSTGPYAKRVPADWARIQEECPNIVRKTPVHFESKVYKAKVAATSHVSVLSSADVDQDPE